MQLPVLIKQVQLEWAESQRLENVEKGVNDLATVGASQGTHEEAVVAVVFAEDRFARTQVGEPGV